MALLQGILNFTTPIPVGDGILLCRFSKQREAQPPILWPAKFSPCTVMLPPQGAIPLAEGMCTGHPVASISLPVLASNSPSNVLVAPPLSSSASSWAESNHSFSRVSSRVPNKAGWCAKAGWSKHLQPMWQYLKCPDQQVTESESWGMVCTAFIENFSGACIRGACAGANPRC